MKIIYDIGANNGDDIPYYLLKCDLVVAVEANPALCQIIEERFSAEISAGRLKIENCAVTADGTCTHTDFYIHTSNHVLSQMTVPGPDELAYFQKVRLPAKGIKSIISTHGDPYYIKIDIEGYDHVLLRQLFSLGIFPPLISSESHSVEVFCLLHAVGNYKAFKLVDGKSVSSKYSERFITSGADQGRVRYSFPEHSAGPFGDDIDGNWMTPESLLRLLSYVGLGWKDIHASRMNIADIHERPLARDYLERLVSREELIRHIKNKAGSWLARRLRLPGHRK